MCETKGVVTLLSPPIVYFHRLLAKRIATWHSLFEATVNQLEIQPTPISAMGQSDKEMPSPPEREANRALPLPPAQPPNRTQTNFFVVLFLFSVLMLGWVLWPFWHLLILAFLLAGIFMPVFRKLLRGVSPWMASLLTCTLIFLIVFIPLLFCIGSLSSEAMKLFEYSRTNDTLLKLLEMLQNNTYINRIEQLITEFGLQFDLPDITSILTGTSKTAGMFIYTHVSDWAANIMSFVVQFCILITVVFFLLIEMEDLLLFIRRLSPLPDEQNILLMDKFTSIAGVILVVNGLFCILQGVLGGLFFALLGIKTPVLWGLIMGILAFIPILGIGMVLLPAAAILLAYGHIGQALATVVFYLILHYTVELLLKPKYVGSQLEMHALLVLLAIFGGMNLFGILGIIYGPLVVSIFLTLSEIYLKEYSITGIGTGPAGTGPGLNETDR